MGCEGVGVLTGLKRLQGFRASDRRNLVLHSHALFSEIDRGNPASYGWPRICCRKFFDPYTRPSTNSDNPLKSEALDETFMKP